MAAPDTDPLRVDQPGAAGIDKHPNAGEREDDSDWEYEYSTTESETYYLTLDLSIPEFAKRSTPSMASGRYGYYSRGGHDRLSLRSHQRKLENAIAEDDGEDDNDGNDEAPEDGDTPAEPRRAVLDGADFGERLSEVQILDLHSATPIISYRGKVFHGQWAENLGSEMIFARHSTTHPLPHVHRLPGGVDVLAVSSARVLTTEKLLVPREKAAREEDPFLQELARLKARHGIHISVVGDKTGERREQARFLENLEAVKVKKGERDGVTVNATGSYNKAFGGHEDPDYRPRKRRAPVSSAQKTPKRGARGGQPRRVRPRRATNTSGVGRGSVQVDEDGPAARTRARSQGGNLSTPTPQRWVDIPAEDDGENGEDETRDLFDGLVLGQGGP